MNEIHQIQMNKIISYLLWLVLMASSGNVRAQDTLGREPLQRRSLDYYLAEGLANSPLLKESVNALYLNRLDSLLNVAATRPYVEGIGQFLFAPAGKNLGYDQNNTNGGLYTGLVQVSQNLLYRRNLQFQNGLNATLRDSVRNAIRINDNDLRKAIVDQYLTAYQDYQQMVVYDSLYQTLSRQNEILKELLRAAIFNQSDYLAFRVDLQQSQINYEGGKLQYLQDLLTLNVLCNIPDTEVVNLENPRLTPQQRYPLDDNPYLLRYRIDSLVVERNRRITDIFYRPSLNAVVNAGTSAVSAAAIGRRLGLSAGLNFSIPIYNGNQRRLQYQKYDIAQLNIQNYRDQYLNRYNLRLRSINEQLRVNQSLLDMTKRQNTDVENLLTVSQARLYQGDMSAIDYLLIVQRYINIKLILNQLDIKAQRLISEFNYRNF